MKRVLCLMTLVAAFLVGCGDDDSAPETPVTPTVQEPERLSKEEYITQADGICAEVNAALGTLQTEDASSAEAAGQRADLYEGMVGNLRDLGTPADSEGLADFLDAGEGLAAAERAAEEAAVDGDDTALADAESDAAAAGTTFSSAATSFGFEDCGQGATTPSAPATAVPPTATAPVTPAEPVPTTPAAPEAPPAPSGGAGTPDAGGGTGGGGTGTGGTTGGSGGVGPG